MKDFKDQPPRYYQDDSLYFLTFNTHKRVRVLCNGEIPNMLHESIIFQCGNLDLKNIAYVFLPEHIHLLLKCRDSKDISSFLQRFKIYTSKQIRKLSNIDHKYIWQRGTFDHVIDGINDFHNHLDYIHFNPVKHGLVNKPENWEWSSYKKYFKNRAYSIGWGWKKLEFDKDEYKDYSWGE